MIHRQLVNVWNPFNEDGKQTHSKVQNKQDGKNVQIVLPAVFSTGIRTDIVNFVHTNVNKNRRQGQAVDDRAGMKHSAESWGTGRAVSRIPRVSGSGTQRSGQGAFGNMCRKGRMFAPLKIWRRWHRLTNLKQRRFALATSIAASAILPLVQARGHRVDKLPELPLVINDSVEKIQRTKEGVRFLKSVGAYPDVKKVVDSIRVRAGRGKIRNRRYITRKGPLVVYSGQNVPMIKALRNIPGVQVVHVSRLNLLQLAPGGHVGRFVIWTEGAFRQLNNIFGTHKYSAVQKKGYNLPTHQVSNPDLSRVINSNQIQTQIRPSQTQKAKHHIQKKNPLTNSKALDVLNPNGKLVREAARKANEEGRKKRQERINAKRGLSADQRKELKVRRANSRKWIGNLSKNLTQTHQKSKQLDISLKKLERQIQ